MLDNLQCHDMPWKQQLVPTFAMCENVGFRAISGSSNRGTGTNSSFLLLSVLTWTSSCRGVASCSGSSEVEAESELTSLSFWSSANIASKSSSLLSNAASLAAKWHGNGGHTKVNEPTPKRTRTIKQRWEEESLSTRDSSWMVDATAVQNRLNSHSHSHSHIHDRQTDMACMASMASMAV